MGIKIGNNLLNGFTVDVRWVPWQGQKWYQAMSMAGDSGYSTKYLTVQGKWTTSTLANQLVYRLFRSIDEIETTLAIGALTDWGGTSPNVQPTVTVMDDPCQLNT